MKSCTLTATVDSCTLTVRFRLAASASIDAQTSRNHAGFPVSCPFGCRRDGGDGTSCREALDRLDRSKCWFRALGASSRHFGEQMQVGSQNDAGIQKLLRRELAVMQ